MKNALGLSRSFWKTNVFVNNIFIIAIEQKAKQKKKLLSHWRVSVIIGSNGSGKQVYQTSCYEWLKAFIYY